MLKFLEKRQTLIAIILAIIILATLLFWPEYINSISIVAVVTSIGLMIALVLQKHWQTYQNAECTQEKMLRNGTIDLLGLLLTIGAAILVGRFAGEYIGLHAGVWVGLASASLSTGLAGFAGGFLAAWAVRSAWGRLSKAIVR